MKKFFFVLPILFFSFQIHAYPDQATLQQAIDLTYKTEFPQAESLLNKYITAHPEEPLGYLFRANNNNWKDVLADLNGKIDSQILADYELANKYAFLLWDKNQENIDRMVTLGNTYMYWAKKWLDVGKKTRAGLVLKKCQKHMEEAIRKDPNRWDAYLAIGVFNFYAGNLPPSLQFLAGLLGISGDEVTGLSQLEKVANNPNLLQPDALVVLTHAYGHTKKNYGAALRYLDRLVAKYSENAHFLSLKGEYEINNKQYDLALKDLDALQSLCSKKSCSQKYQFLRHFFAAGALIEQKNTAKALPHVLEAEKLNPARHADRNAMVELYKGLILKSEGKTSEASETLKKVLTMPGAGEQTIKRAQEALP